MIGSMIVLKYVSRRRNYILSCMHGPGESYQVQSSLILGRSPQIQLMLIDNSPR